MCSCIHVCVDTLQIPAKNIGFLGAEVLGGSELPDMVTGLNLKSSSRSVHS